MATSKPISPFRLSTLLRSQTDPTLALQLFLNPNPNPNPNPNRPFRHSLLSYDLIITKLGRAKMLPQMEQILQQLQQDTRHRVPEPLLCHVISFYARARLPSRAIQTFFSIPSFRCTPSLKSFNSLLNALLSCRQFQTFTDFASLSTHFPPNPCTYNILIQASFLQNQIHRAYELFDEMRKREIHPNAVTFGTLIHGLCKNSRLTEAFKMKELMIGEFKLKPSVSIYNSLIKGVCEIGDIDWAFRIKNEMLRNKLSLDTAVYNTLINALFKGGRKEKALEVLEEMKENGCQWNSVTCNVMISEFCRENNLEQVFRILDGVDHGVKLDVVGYNVVIGWLCKQRKWSEANDLFQDMPRRGCVPDVVTYRTLFDGLCRWLQFREAAAILDEMMFKGYVPHPKSLNEFVGELCQEGNFELLSLVLSGLASRGNVCTEGIWNVLVSMVSKEEKLVGPFEIFNTLVAA